MRIQQYIVREVVLATIGITVVLWSFLLCQELVVAFSRASRGDLAFSLLFPLLGLHIAHFFAVIWPLACTLGIVVALGRLYTDGEMTAAFIAGLRQTALPTLLLSWIAGSTAITAVLHLGILPPLAKSHDALLQIAKSKQSLELIQPGSFYPYREGVFFIGTRDSKSGVLTDIFMANGDPADPNFALLRARKGEWIDTPGERAIRVEAGYYHHGAAPLLEKYITQFATMAIPMQDPHTPPFTHPHSKSNGELFQSHIAADWSELLMRISAPLMIAQLALWAVGIAAIPPKGSRMQPILWAIAGFFIYHQGLLLIRVATERETLPLVAFPLWHVLMWGVGYIGALRKRI